MKNMITTIINIIIITVVIFITIKINIIIIIYHRTRRLKDATAPARLHMMEHVINLSQLKTIILMLNYSTTFNQINNNKKKSKDPNTLDFYELDPFDLRVNV
jgi:heme/copper-type cytochrome/quinol oxidase subunit 2